jgi:iron complex outermembrane recepter protein
MATERAAGALRTALALLVVAGMMHCAPAFADSLGRPIPSQPLSDALETFGRQTGLQLIYRSALSQGVMSHAVPAGKPVDESLTILLRGTGLDFAYVNERTVTIVRERQAAQLRRAPLRVEVPVPEHHESLGTQDGAPFSPDASGGDETDPLAQIVVTGSHISGVQPVGAQVLTITRDDIDRSGHATVQDVLRALPQNFSGGPDEDGFGNTQESLYNTSRSTGINLRGLGAGSTLVLVNGRRMAAGAGDGRFVDVSGIPLSAVERIEILPDGASAIYGADAVGGVVNFILRNNYEGAETGLRFGSATDGGPTQADVSQALGTRWDSGNGFFSLEYYKREKLAAAERGQSASSDLRPFGGDNFDSPAGSPGTIIGSSRTWAIPANQDGSSLLPGDLVAGTANLHNRNEALDLLPDQERWTIFGTASQELGENGRAFADVLLFQRSAAALSETSQMNLRVPSTNPFYVNPAGGTGPVTVAYSFADDLGPQRDEAEVSVSSVAVGATFDVTPSWRITPSVTHARSRDFLDAGPFVDQAALAAALADPDPLTAFNPFGDGSFTNPETLARIRSEQHSDSRSALTTLSATADGTLLSLSGSRDVRLALGLDHRTQSLQSRSYFNGTSTGETHGDREITATYAELMVPLVDKSNRRRGIERAGFSLAARYEDYSDFGGALTPRVAFSWSPLQTVSLRGNWSSSFKAPNLADLDESRNVLLNLMQRDSGGFAPVLVWSGANEELHDERATTWTMGADIDLPSHPLSFSLNYFNISYRDRVERIDYNMSMLEDPAFAEVVLRNPAPEDLQRVCSRATFMASGVCTQSQVAAIIDVRLDNVAVMRTSGIDVLGRYDFESAFGTFDVQLNATWLMDFAQARFRSSALTDLLDTQGNPIDFRARGLLTWERGHWGAHANLHYLDNYRDTASRPQRKVGSWMTLDLGVKYRAPAEGWLEDSVLGLNVSNVFNQDPPFLNNPVGVGYDTENADLLGRFVSVRITRYW